MTSRLARLWQPGNPQRRVFLPDFWMAVVDSPKAGRGRLPPYCVKFECDPKMNREDIYQYLIKIYRLPVREVRVRVQQGEIEYHTPHDYRNRKAMWKEDDKKIAYVYMDKGFKFNFPDIFAKDEETEMEKKFDEYQEGMLHNTQFVNRDRNGTLNVFYSSTTCLEDSMIHLSVPDTQVLVERFDSKRKYIAYNIHINGFFHAAVRFNHLFNFAEQIRQRFELKYRGPEFPPKRVFQLDAAGVEDRRIKIAKYLNALVQYPEIMRHSYVEKSFLDFQIESYRATSIFVSVDVYLADGEKHVIKCNVNDNTSQILKLLCSKLEYHDCDRILAHFGLFMVSPRGSSQTEASDVMIIRLLRNFESPYISLQNVNMKSAAQGVYHKLMLRKLIWDPKLEEPLLQNPLLSDLIFRQAKADFQHGQFTVLKEEQEVKLRAALQRDDKQQFLKLCHQQPSYSYEWMQNCESDYPVSGTKVQLKIGRRQIVLLHGDQFSTVSIFRATRIRVWRISQPVDDADQLIFQFEYLMAKDTFEWITIHTNQAILLSLLLQSIGAEILNEVNNMSIEEQMFGSGKSSAAADLEAAVTTRRTMPEIRSKPAEVIEKELEKQKEEEESRQHANKETNGHGSNGRDSSPADPLGVAAFDDLFTTISDTLPQHNAAFSAINDSDL
ncbi:hypothetical protein WR25_14938 [Diploscapter pachys]|uniref:Large ribosomal subunit protein uL23m n=1 Tax=Diploscapter pachys TaxID=2018661 RepID=A0A2A2LS60_9BILA|nr:hypothetical protein WR25_14938 [Diploscapter pachys]